MPAITPINMAHILPWSIRPLTPGLREIVERIESVEPTPHVRQRVKFENALRNRFNYNGIITYAEHRRNPFVHRP